MKHVTVTNEEIKRQTLAFVNDARERAGEEPLSELPKGYRGSAGACPVAKALPGKGRNVGLASAGWSTPRRLFGLTLGEKHHRRTLPFPVAAFVWMFDAGQFPEYDAIVRPNYNDAPYTNVPDAPPASWVLDHEDEKVLV